MIDAHSLAQNTRHRLHHPIDVGVRSSPVGYADAHGAAATPGRAAKESLAGFEDRGDDFISAAVVSRRVPPKSAELLTLCQLLSYLRLENLQAGPRAYEHCFPLVPARKDLFKNLVHVSYGLRPRPRLS